MGEGTGGRASVSPIRVTGATPFPAWRNIDLFYEKYAGRFRYRRPEYGILGPGHRKQDHLIAEIGRSLNRAVNKPGAYVFNRPRRESSLIASSDLRWLIDHTGSLDTSLASLSLLELPSAPMKASWCADSTRLHVGRGGARGRPGSGCGIVCTLQLKESDVCLPVFRLTESRLPAERSANKPRSNPR
jgi:hypothetical protein